MAYSTLVADNLINTCQYEQNCKLYLKNEIKQVLTNFPSLVPKVTPFNISGTTYNLFSLDGTIPVNYKQQTYNVPVRITYPNHYPHYSPTAWVTPTQDMIVKPSEFVREDGVCTLDVLRNWRPNLSTFQLVEQMRSAFSAKMPVFKTPPQGSQPQTFHQTQGSQPQTFHQPSRGFSQPSGSMFDRKKLEKLYNKVVSELHSEIQSLEEEEKTLDSRQEYIAETIEKVSQELNNSESKQSQILITVEKVNNWIQNSEEINYESLRAEDYLEFSNPYLKQYMKLKAEEEAYEEIIGHVVKAYNEELISTNEMQKQIKTISNQQFMKLRLMDKVAHVGNLIN